MKLTKSQLREMIREEISKFNKPKMSTRLKELINKGWVLSEEEGTVKNPLTGRTIKIKTALSYKKDHPAYKAAVQAKGKVDTSQQGSGDKPKMSRDAAKSFIDDFDKSGVAGVRSNLESPQADELDGMFRDIDRAETPEEKLKAFDTLVDNAENWKEDWSDDNSPTVLSADDITYLKKNRDKYKAAVSSL
jgi:hypothetical protein